MNRVNFTNCGAYMILQRMTRFSVFANLTSPQLVGPDSPQLVGPDSPYQLVGPVDFRQKESVSSWTDRPRACAVSGDTRQCQNSTQIKQFRTHELDRMTSGVQMWSGDMPMMSMPPHLSGSHTMMSSCHCCGKEEGRIRNSCFSPVGCKLNASDRSLVICVFSSEYQIT